jgi:hypothetical protein
MASNVPDAPDRPVEPLQDEDRRRLLKCGLIAAPLLVTLAARPAAAQQAMGGSLGVYDYGTADPRSEDLLDEDAAGAQGAGSLRGPRR